MSAILGLSLAVVAWPASHEATPIQTTVQRLKSPLARYLNPPRFDRPKEEANFRRLQLLQMALTSRQRTRETIELIDMYLDGGDRPAHRVSQFNRKKIEYQLTVQRLDEEIQRLSEELSLVKPLAPMPREKR